ncbi:glycosyltransferase family 2 protein [Aestuariirhabdus sp. LZHN29]|uniref:glycosyltransferase family 2 protein n=1 Tax=Aestuariirhabdus sp. LZHN29 TaxID=3417462 RepID=UPI003CF5E451
MNRPPRISVVVPVYNGEKTLARALDSLIEQDVSPYEVIVVDDGSTDGSAAVAARYGERISLIQQDNLGVSVARNRGVAHASGDWLAFLDADDWYYPHRLSCHAELIQRYPKLDLLSGNFHYVYEDGSSQENIDALDWGGELRNSAEGAMVLIDKHLRRKYAGQHVGDTHTLTLRRDLFLRVGGYPEGVAIAEDMSLLLRALDHSAWQAVVLTPLAAYCVHSTSAIRRRPLASQRLALETYRDLLGSYQFQRQEVLLGAGDALRRARLDLSYALLSNRHYPAAVINQVNGLLSDPGIFLRKVRDLLSVLRGRSASA